MALTELSLHEVHFQRTVVFLIYTQGCGFAFPLGWYEFPRLGKLGNSGRGCCLSVGL